MNNYESLEQKLKQEKEKTSKQMTLIVTSILLAKQWGIPYEDNDELIFKVQKIAKDKWIEENYSDGEDIDHSCCSECSNWEFGEPRCSCGNRRMSLHVSGNVVDGFEAYVEAY